MDAGKGLRRRQTNDSCNDFQTLQYLRIEPDKKTSNRGSSTLRFCFILFVIITALGATLYVYTNLQHGSTHDEELHSANVEQEFKHNANTEQIQSEDTGESNNSPIQVEQPSQSTNEVEENVANKKHYIGVVDRMKEIKKRRKRKLATEKRDKRTNLEKQSIYSEPIITKDEKKPKFNSEMLQQFLDQYDDVEQYLAKHSEQTNGENNN